MKTHTTFSKWIILIVMVITLNSCYKDNATFTIEVKGSQPTYVVNYTNERNVFIENDTVYRGWYYYKEYESNWRLNIKVEGLGIAKDSIIKINVYKREHIIATFEGSKKLIVNSVINH